MSQSEDNNGKKKTAFIDKAGLIIALISLALAWYGFDHSVKSSEKQNEIAIEVEIAQHRPMLYMEFNKVDSYEDNGLVLKNIGNGTAIIKDYKYYFDKDELKTSPGHQSWLTDNGVLRFQHKFDYEKITMLVPGTAVLFNENGIDLLATRGYLRGEQKKPGNYKEESFYFSDERKTIEKIIVEIEYKSLSQFDDSTYFLRFSESFVQNNIRDRNISPIYEQGH